MRKAICIIEMPSCCTKCYWHRLKWHHPFWSDENPGTIGLYCELDKHQKRITKLDIDDESFKPDWCPLREVPKKKAPSQLPPMADMPMRYTNYERGYNACLDEILKGGS